MALTFSRTHPSRRIQQLMGLSGTSSFMTKELLPLALRVFIWPQGVGLHSGISREHFQEHPSSSANRDSHENMKDLRCMSFTSKGTSEILVAGVQAQMFTIDVNKGEITKEVCFSAGYPFGRLTR